MSAHLFQNPDKPGQFCSADDSHIGVCLFVRPERLSYEELVNLVYKLSGLENPAKLRKDLQAQIEACEGSILSLRALVREKKKEKKKHEKKLRAIGG